MVDLKEIQGKTARQTAFSRATWSPSKLADSPQDSALPASSAIAVEDDISDDRSDTKRTGSLLKAFVFGGLEGMMTTFAFIAASVGAGESGRTVLIIGFANAVADAFTMGFGEYVAASAERDHALAEWRKEELEVANHFDDELREMIQAYERRGFSAEDASTMGRIVAKDRTRLVEERMLQTFGVVSSDSNAAHGVRQGVVMFLSFILFGIVPLVSYLFHRGRGIDGSFAAACAITGLGLLALGAAKGHLTTQSIPVTSVKMLACGALSGAVSFTLSVIIGRMLAEDDMGAALA